jgi:hypothetical protein
VNHTFLLEPGRWVMQGNWLERNSLPIPLKGLTLVVWNRAHCDTRRLYAIVESESRPHCCLSIS